MVSGVVTLDDVPLTRGLVQFQPGMDGPPAVGAIAADGKYELVTALAEAFEDPDCEPRHAKGEPASRLAIRL